MTFGVVGLCQAEPGSTANQRHFLEKRRRVRVGVWLAVPLAMKLRTRLDVFSTALLSALGATQLLACGGSAATPGTGSAGSGSGGGASSAGAAQGGASTGGAGHSGGASSAGAAQGGASTGGAGHSGGASSAGATGSAGAGANKYPCQNPVDLGNGLIRCDGFTHRHAALTCASRVPRPDPVATPGSIAQCKLDADCTDRPLGWCGNSDTMGITVTHCNYGCVNDSDCATTQLCECSAPVGRCVVAQCTTDEDCTAGFLCRSHDLSGGCDNPTYTCQSPADKCGGDRDCAQGEHCYLNSQTHSFQCAPATCLSGRPFLIEGAPRLATAAANADWRGLSLLPKAADLAPVLRARLAEQWTQVALMEHASIAAFARFTLQLMSLGAPASLIERATAAMADETKHAKACFAVASQYAAAPLGPGCLAIAGSLDESTLEAIVLNTVREGCLGETLAAIEAREAAEHASDPALRELLLTISEDETRHAELAYRFVKWALSWGGPELQRAVQREFSALAAETPRARGALTDDDQALLAHGIVPNQLRQTIRQQAIAEVILPCSRALFEPRHSAPQASAERAATSRGELRTARPL